MSTEARRAPIPPRPSTPPPPATPPRPSTPPRPAEPPTSADTQGEQQDGGPDAASAAQPRQNPSAADTAATAPPPPRASARFPDTPPSAGRQDSGGSLHRDSAPGDTPPRPPERPSPPRRPAAPAETAAETTFRLRPIRMTPPSSPEQGNRPYAERPQSTERPQAGSGRAQGPVGTPAPSGSGRPHGSVGTPAQPGTGGPQGSSGMPAQASSGPAPGSAGMPRKPSTGPAHGSGPMPPHSATSATQGPGAMPPHAAPSPAQSSAGMSPRPATRPGSAPGEPPRGPASVALPPQRPAPRPSAGNGSEARGYAASAPAGSAPDTQHSTHAGHSSNGHGSAAFSPDPSLSWSAPMAPGGSPGAGRPVVSFGQPEGYDEQARPRPLGLRIRPRVAVAAAGVVLGLGLIGGAVTGSWLIGEPGDGGTQDTFATAGSLWHSVPVDQLFPPTVIGRGAGPGGADRTWTRIAVAPDTGCANAFDPLLRKALSTVGCERLLRATYIDATQSYVTTVGLLFTTADATAMRSLDTRFTKEGLDRRTDLMPRSHAAKGTPAAGFGDEQRASWTVSVLTDAPVVVYAVSGWADDRTVDEPEPAKEAMESGDTTAVAQAGLGHEAQGLADRVERSLRKNVGTSTEQPS
ncbi:hypothetical protein [Streptomyces sp. NBC_01614]|uniref:hypothetical protein n=1 Tax=Streptomyces sp. NBC_01614 TaxID=2975897 RepID=UPI00386DF264